MANPAASSAAELILSPVDRRSMAVVIARSFLVIAFDASVALTFVLITVIAYPLIYNPRFSKLLQQCEH